MSQNVLTTTNPTTGKVIEIYEMMSDQELQEAITTSHRAFLSWRQVDISERAKAIRSLGKALEESSDSLAQLMTQEMGKLLKQSKQEIQLCAQICRYTAEEGVKQLESQERDIPNGERGLISFSPIGIIYGIQPWNFPCYQVMRFAVANLLAGNSVLLRHAENVTGSGLKIQRIVEESGIPEGLFTCLRISHDQSDSVIKDDRIRGVTFTGSSEVGRDIASKAAKELKKTVMELGSNDAYLVLEDADLDRAVEQCVKGRTYNNGETCIAAKRFIVVDAVYDQFRDAFVKAMKDLKFGDPLNEDVDVGPMARNDLREQLHEQVEMSVAKGASLVCGGEIPEGEGYFYPPTVLENVVKGQPAYKDELFGPVASLIRAKDADHALEIANDSRFGLGGGIFTKDAEKAVSMATRHFDTGMIFVNGFGLSLPNMPFGGVKDSGYGREHGGFGVREFVNVKSVMVQS